MAKRAPKLPDDEGSADLPAVSESGAISIPSVYIQDPQALVDRAQELALSQPVDALAVATVEELARLAAAMTMLGLMTPGQAKAANALIQTAYSAAALRSGGGDVTKKGGGLKALFALEIQGKT